MPNPASSQTVFLICELIARIQPLQNIRDLLVTYGDALLALDICGLDDQTLSEILGPKVECL